TVFPGGDHAEEEAVRAAAWLDDWTGVASRQRSGAAVEADASQLLLLSVACAAASLENRLNLRREIDGRAAQDRQRRKRRNEFQELREQHHYLSRVYSNAAEAGDLRYSNQQDALSDVLFHRSRGVHLCACRGSQTGNHRHGHLARDSLHPDSE